MRPENNNAGQKLSPKRLARTRLLPWKELSASALAVRAIHAAFNLAAGD